MGNWHVFRGRWIALQLRLPWKGERPQSLSLPPLSLYAQTSVSYPRRGQQREGQG